MKGKMYSKHILLCISILSLCIVGGVLNIGRTSSKVESRAIDDLISTQTTTINQVEPTEVLREYSKYSAELQLMSGGYFTGIETIKYIHEFKTSANQILIKLDLNSQSAEFKKLYLNQEQNLGIEYYGDIFVTDVRVNGEKVPFEQETTNLWVNLKQEIVEDQEVNVSLAFHGKLPQVSVSNESNEPLEWTASLLPKMGVFEESKGWNIEDDYSLAESAYTEISDYKVTFLVKDFEVPVATGTLIEDQELEDGTQKYVYEAKKVRNFGIYYGSKFNEYLIETASGVNIHIYTHRQLDIGIIGARINEIFNYYNTILGRYPYDKFKIIDRENLEQELTYSGILVTDLDEAIIHYEKLYNGIGKQWIPYILQSHVVKDKWLYIGLGEYIARRGTTSVEGIRKYLDICKEKNTEMSEQQQNKLNYLEFFYQLEEVLGSEEWIKFLKTYYKQNAFKVTSTESFIKLLLEDTEQEINQLFNTYISANDEGRNEIR
ncbi:MAG: hypothetical protein ACRCTE_01295 [Cellulosilyticaceae bacterium]